MTFPPGRVGRNFQTGSMHLFWKVTVLLLSHVGLIVLVALLSVQRDADILQQAAFDDPWYRVGLQLSPWGKTPPAGLPPVKSDLAAVAAGFPDTTSQLAWLVAHLHGLDNGGQLNVKGAAAACHALGWQQCDLASLRVFQVVLQRGVQ